MLLEPHTRRLEAYMFAALQRQRSCRESHRAVGSRAARVLPCITGRGRDSFPSAVISFEGKLGAPLKVMVTAQHAT